MTSGIKKTREYLIGKTLKDLKIAKDKMALLFILDGGEEMIARTDGDCCSVSWIESVELVSFPCAITSIEDVPMSSIDEDECTLIQIYCTKINTTKGCLIIEYRNESNGYYGGSICFGDEYFYGGVGEQNISSLEWVDIKCD